MSIGDENDEHVDVPVLIVGGGPTGLLSAYLLSKHGIRSLLIEKYPERLAAPKAHALSPRSLEICRQYGLDTNELRKLGTSRGEACWVNFLTNLSGERIGRLPYERMDAAVLDDTPEMIHNIPQPDFEAYVASRLAQDDNVEIQKGVAFVACEQVGDVIITTVEERTTKTRRRLTSRYVLACDGAKSRVREVLGIDTEGEDGYETMMTIHFSADLRPVVGDRQGMLHWILDPACSGFIIAYDIAGNQVLISNFDSAKHPAATWTEELARTTVAAAIGQDIDFKLLSYRPWVLSRKVAREYQRGNVFLVGDAAHSFPPTGGLGLNSGLADAHNIVYKLAAVYHGQAGRASLLQYTTERRPIALINSAQSVKNGKKIFSFLKAVGVAGIGDLCEARQNLLKTIRDPEKQDLIAAHVEGQREHFDNLGIHVGYIYPNSTPPANASIYQPSFQAGARLPHAWIKPRNLSAALQQHDPIDTSYVREFSASDVTARQWSTLDLCSPGTYTLVVSREADWTQRFTHAKQMLKFRPFQLRLWAADTDFEFTNSKHSTLFGVEADFDAGGGLLIRPDQHLLGRVGEQSTAEELATVIGKDASI